MGLCVAYQRGPFVKPLWERRRAKQHKRLDFTVLNEREDQEKTRKALMNERLTPAKIMTGSAFSIENKAGLSRMCLKSLYRIRRKPGVTFCGVWSEWIPYFLKYISIFHFFNGQLILIGKQSQQKLGIIKRNWNLYKLTWWCAFRVRFNNW